MMYDISPIKRILFYNTENFNQDAIKDEIEQLRSRLKDLYLQLSRLEHSNEASQSELLYKGLADLYSKYPKISLSLAEEEDKIILSSDQQNIQFHTHRTHKGVNSDIVYITNPFYSFSCDLYLSGDIAIKMKGNSNALLDKLCLVNKLIKSITTPSGGSCHPNARKDDTHSSYFTTICTGNNPFRNTYYQYIKNHGSVVEFLTALTQLIAWLYSANLSDMYDSTLYKDIVFIDWFYSNAAREFADGLFAIIRKYLDAGNLQTNMNATETFHSLAKELHDYVAIAKDLPDDSFALSIGNICGLIQETTSLEDNRKFFLPLFRGIYALWLLTNNISPYNRACFPNALAVDILYLLSQDNNPKIIDDWPQDSTYLYFETINSVRKLDEYRTGA